MATPNDTQLRMIAEVVSECAKYRGTSFDTRAEGIARAAVIDPRFRARVAAVHRRLEAQYAADIPHRMLASIALVLSDLEKDAEGILSRP